MSNTYCLTHHGIKGQRWGVRRFQNADGTLTSAGRKRTKVSANTEKWATSKHQPSSTKSSVLAGLYAATGNERIGKALDRSNDKDAERWKKSKEQYAASGKKVATKILDKAKNKAVTKWVEENKANKEKIREKIMDEIFPRMPKQPWDEKPSNDIPWDEKPKKTTHNI